MLTLRRSKLVGGIKTIHVNEDHSQIIFSEEKNI